MSTWTSDGRAPRTAAALAFVALLGGCVEGALVAGGGRPVVERLAVTSGALTVAGPSGYCIDDTASRDRGDSAFVLLGTCAALSGSPARPQPARPAILTASVLTGAPTSRPLAEDFRALAAFFSTPAGRAALSRTGRAETVAVREVVSVGETLFIRATDTSPAAGEAVEPEYWRAILALRGRIVTLSALGVAARPLSSADKRAALDAFVARIRRENPPQRVAAATAP